MGTEELDMPTALITGASRGLGAALGAELAGRGWDLIVDARDGAALAKTVETWGRALFLSPATCRLRTIERSSRARSRSGGGSISSSTTRDFLDRPEPETVIPAFLRLIEDRPSSGRYKASDFAVTIGERA